MEQGQASGVARVAACAAAAAHRRDHRHWRGADCCHPHEVEVVHLGVRALAVCHDCGADTGFLPRRDAERMASGHRTQTRTDSVPVPSLVAA